MAELKEKQDVLGLSEGFADKESTSTLMRNLDKFLDFSAWVIWYPDLFLDLNTPAEGGIKLHLDQRVFLRCNTRFFSEYGCFPRGYGKTLLEVLGMMIVGIRYPYITLTMSAQTKDNAIKILKEKYDEIIRFYPFFANEVAYTSFTKNDCKIVFNNEAKIDVLANSQSSKGLRRKRLSIEESALMDNFTFEDAMKPLTEVPRNTCGKLSTQNPQELNGQIHFFTTPSFRGSDEYQRSLGMVRSMRDLQGDIVIGSDWKLPCWYGRGSSKKQILKKKREMSPISFDMNYGGKWTGTSSGALVGVNKLMNCRTLTEPVLESESDDDEFYIGVDVARSEKKTNNQSSVAVGRVIRDKKNRNRIITVQLVNLIHIPNYYNFATQACTVKKIQKLYNAEAVVVDVNGLGVGLAEELMKINFDPKTGITYGSWDTINTSDEPEEKNAPKILFDLKAQGINTKIIANFISMVDSNKLQFLESRRGGDYEIKTDDDIMSKVMPYVQEELFFQEVNNLKLKQSGKNLSIERVVRGIDKDRFSAVAYMLYYINEYKGIFTEEKKVNSQSYVEMLKKINRRPRMY